MNRQKTIKIILSHLYIAQFFIQKIAGYLLQYLCLDDKILQHAQLLQTSAGTQSYSHYEIWHFLPKYFIRSIAIPRSLSISD